MTMRVWDHLMLDCGCFSRNEMKELPPLYDVLYGSRQCVEQTRMYV